MALDPLILSRAQSWLKAPFDPNTIAEIDQLFNAGDEKELYERFYTELEFGTGGLRGIMGAGLNRMNRYTVGACHPGIGQLYH